ncbi:MAG: acetolactate synthase small subunit [Acidimicrobiaceae bacterium]|jgi:acetolactate synthase-1/3 small subunit|nr:acetolactate synthase small subunit [Acidimicrobiaceae bacterium]|tara:strand:+ start:57701 stop:58189 length:489 start_codon:yes stop_codon:yes gene_type:complete
MVEQFHTLVVRVENKPGVLARVSGLFARRGFNIQSLAVAPTDNELFSRLTIVVDAESAPLDQVVKQLDKLINVVRIQELSQRDSVNRELILATVKLIEGKEDNIMRDIESFDANVLSVGEKKIMVSLSGPPEVIDEFETVLEKYGIVEVQRTGIVALATIAR